MTATTILQRRMPIISTGRCRHELVKDDETKGG